MTPFTRLAIGTRLALLAALAAGSLIAASFVAWRLARTTDAFAIRQAELSVQTAVSQLARELHDFPAGRTTPRRDPAPGDGRGRGGGRGGPPRPGPPHEQRAFALFSDPLTRSSLIALQPLTEVAGGFIRDDGTLAGYVFPARAGTPAATEISSEARAALAQAVAAARSEQDIVVRRIAGSGGLTIVAASPLSAADAASSGIAAAVALETLSSMSASSDPVNLLAAATLLASVALVIVFALATVRDLQTGVRAIEDGLDNRTVQDGAMLPPPTPELARIAAAINVVAGRSRARREREQALERELRQQEHLAALGRLVAAVAHEVRNPLASMKLKVQMAERGGYAADRFEPTARVIVDEVDRLDHLVRRLLELGRPPITQRAPVDLRNLIEARLTLMAERFERAHVAVTLEWRAAQGRVEGDADRLAQVVDNVLQNAMEAMSDGGRLTVVGERSSDTTADRIVVSFSDTGAGVKREDRALIFEPFYTRRDGGTGLGLAIAREIVEAHAGRISLTDAPGGGAMVSIELPARSPVR